MKIVRKYDQIYAKGTKVTIEKSIEEIKKMLKKYGCKGFTSAESREDERRKAIKFFAPTTNGDLPIILEAPEIYVTTRKGEKYLEKESYRALALIVKSKLVTVDLGLETVQDAFILDVITSDGRKMKDLITKDIPLLTQGNER